MVTDGDSLRPTQTFRDSLERFGDDWVAVLSDDEVAVPGSIQVPPCQVFFAGHRVHPLQVHMSVEEPHRMGVLAGVGSQVIAIDFGEVLVTYLNHEPESLLGAVGIGGNVSVCERYQILRTSTGYPFSLAYADRPLSPCDFEPLIDVTFDALAERLRSHGGFLVPNHALPS